MAASGGHKTIVKLLIENGADPNDENVVRIFQKNR